jgi:ArsR family transcriptional regulator, arsenate/arsenite/antimonite-responsive transcriptional repressor
MNDKLIYSETEDMLPGDVEKPGKISRPVVCNPDLQPYLNDDVVEGIAAIFKAIAHPVRIKILDLIQQGNGEACSCDIERFFELSQPTISHHIKVLQEAGLISSEPRGVWVYHKIRTDTFDVLQRHLSLFKTEG